MYMDFAATLHQAPPHTSPTVNGHILSKVTSVHMYN